MGKWNQGHLEKKINGKMKSTREGKQQQKTAEMKKAMSGDFPRKKLVTMIESRLTCLDEAKCKYIKEMVSDFLDGMNSPISPLWFLLLRVKNDTNTHLIQEKFSYLLINLGKSQIQSICFPEKLLLLSLLNIDLFSIILLRYSDINWHFMIRTKDWTFNL